MQLLPKIEIIDLALYVDSTLVISDIHIGYEEALNKQGILIPRMQIEDLIKRIQNIFEQLKGRPLDAIIVNGDLKHEFGTISEQEWRNTLKFIDLLLKNCRKLILIKGNHDTILRPIARKRDVEVKDFHIIHVLSNNDQANTNKTNTESNNRSIKNKITATALKLFKSNDNPKNVLIAHGDKIPPKETLKEVDTIIIGHEHPAISLKSGPRVETFKCYLRGKFKGKYLIAQPSFNHMVEGTNIQRGKTLSPFLKQNLDNFEVYAVEDKIYYFGKLKNLR